MRQGYSQKCGTMQIRRIGPDIERGRVIDRRPDVWELTEASHQLHTLYLRLQMVVDKAKRTKRKLHYFKPIKLCDPRDIVWTKDNSLIRR